MNKVTTLPQGSIDLHIRLPAGLHQRLTTAADQAAVKPQDLVRAILAANLRDPKDAA